MEINTAVLLLFFIREDTFQQVFNAVKKAKPKRLYLFQDGPRKNHPNDLEKIKKCRKICENISWDCEVYRNYQKKNLGCDPAEFAAISWGFENEEKLIILEDDDVPSMSFFRYCDELLDRYVDDKRIFMICGRNQLGQTDYDNNSYFFAKADSIWGWASWRDRWLLCDYKHEFLNDSKLTKKVKNGAPTRYDGRTFINKCKKHRKISILQNRVASYESSIRAAEYLNDMVAIIPRNNLVKNVGITGDSEHTSVGLASMPKENRKLYLIDAMELEFPLRHPDTFMENNEFLVQRLKRLGADCWIRFFFRRVKGYYLRNIINRGGYNKTYFENTSLINCFLKFVNVFNIILLFNYSIEWLMCVHVEDTRKKYLQKNSCVYC